MPRYGSTSYTPRTPDKKRIKVHSMIIDKTDVDGTGVWEGLDWAPQDDIRIVGLYIHLRISLPDTPNVQEGMVDASAMLSRGSYVNNVGALIWTSGRMINVVEAAYAHALADTCRERDIQFAQEGSGIDVDDGEILTLWAYGRQNILSAGTAIVAAVAMVYYVER